MNDIQVMQAIPLVLRHGRINEYPELVKLFRSQSLSVLSDLLTWQGKLFHKLHKSVCNELHRAKMFTRLCVSQKMILYTSLPLVHDIGDFICEYFVERFPDCTILIYDGVSTFIGKSKHGHVSISRESISLDDIKNSLESDSLSKFDFSTSFDKKTWDDFYEGQYIESRRNVKYFSHNIPKKIQDQFSLDVEKCLVQGNETLLKFI